MNNNNILKKYTFNQKILKIFIEKTNQREIAKIKIKINTIKSEFEKNFNILFNSINNYISSLELI